MPTQIPRIDLNLKLVTKAKRTLRQKNGIRTIASVDQLQKVPFSATLDFATEHYLKEVIEGLHAAGVRKQPELKPTECRPRRVNAKTWAALGKAAESAGVSRMMLVRAILTLMGDQYHT